MGRLRSSKVDDFGTNRKRVCDFLLVCHCNYMYGPVLHRIWDMATYWLKIAYFSYYCLIRRPSLPMFPLEFRCEVNREETRVMGLSYSEDRMILAWVVLTWYRTVTDGRTDRQTDGQRQTESIIANTALCMASYADALINVVKLLLSIGS